MTEEQIFKKLFDLGRSDTSKMGMVSSALVREGEIIASSPSSDALFRHAEDLVIEKAMNGGTEIQPSDILYVTLQPCGRRTPGGPGAKFGDCTSRIIGSGIKNVVFAAKDSGYSQDVLKRFAEAGVSCRQIDNSAIEAEAVALFTSTLTDEEYKKQRGSSHL